MSEQINTVACIQRIPNEDFWRVRCHDGERIMEIQPPDPHASGWPSYQDAYAALFAWYPRVSLIGVESWYIGFAHEFSHFQGGEYIPLQPAIED